MTFIKRLMYIKEEQLKLAMTSHAEQIYIGSMVRQILELLEGRKDGKRKISRKNIVPNRFGRR